MIASEKYKNIFNWSGEQNKKWKWNSIEMEIKYKNNHNKCFYLSL